MALLFVLTLLFLLVSLLALGSVRGGGRRRPRGAASRIAALERANRELRDELAACARDEAARRRAEAGYVALLDSVDGIVWEADATTFRFRFVSAQAERLLGYPASRWTDEPSFWADHLHPEDRAWCVKLCTEATTALSPHDLEYRMIAADGSVVWLYDVVTVVAEDGRATLLRGIMVDATARRQADEERRHVDERLTRYRERLEALAAERGRLLDEAQAALRVRDVFLTVASHELKTPLTPLRLNLQLIQHKLGGRDPGGRLAGRVAVAERQVERLAQLVDDMLDVTRAGSGRFDVRPAAVDVAALAREVASRFEAGAARVRCAIELRAPSPAVAGVDPARIEQVLENLLANALRYGAGKPVEVTVTARSGGVRLTVRDHGIGVAPEDRERIFGLFERAVSERRYGGLGLGLYIARQIVEAHGGTIGCESVPGEGARFEVELPASPPGTELQREMAEKSATG
jgi:PAS domain S-box-containing protein